VLILNPSNTYAAKAQKLVAEAFMRRLLVTVLILLIGTAAVAADTRFRVAVLIFPYAEDIDFAAPIEVLGHTGAQIFTVAATKNPITTVFGLHITPDYDLASAPASDLVIVPGGGVNDTAKSEVVQKWLRDRATTNKYVMSVCNGAFILANAGLLDGLTATTTAGRIDELAEFATKTHVVRRRIVDNGKIITTAGLSAGIDGALHVIERQWNRERAEDIARGIEYRWDPDSKWTRAALADTRLPDVKLPDDAIWEKLSSHGDTDRWEMHGRLRIAMTEEQALDMATKQLTANGWTLRENAKGKRSWTKKDREGQTWLTTLSSKPDSAPSTYIETMSIRRIVG
jgi:putative intracellular protease/amidase